jgi:hypothetical protein
MEVEGNSQNFRKMLAFENLRFSMFAERRLRKTSFFMPRNSMNFESSATVKNL